MKYIVSKSALTFAFIIIVQWTFILCIFYRFWNGVEKLKNSD